MEPGEAGLGLDSSGSTTTLCRTGQRMSSNGTQFARSSVMVTCCSWCILRSLGTTSSPGWRGVGGVRAQAIIREVSEECGRTVTQVGDVLVRAVEHRRAREPGHMFRMESTYYPCAVGDEVHDQSLDDYEQDLVLTPVWVSIDEALKTNQRVLASGLAPTWVTRETRVLRALRDLG